MVGQMQALLLTSTGPRLRTDCRMPEISSGEALIRVRVAGICATDLELINGYKGGFRGVLGHEFVGDVTAAPDDETWVGRRVVGEINIGCGACDLCRRGLGKHCRQRQSLGIIGRDGAFAEYLTLPLANLHVVPQTLSDDEAVFAEPLAAALQVVEQVHITPNQRVYLVGDGRLGLLVAQVLALTGCRLVVLGRHPEKLDLLHQWGINDTIVAGPQEIDHLAEQPADIVVEATGSEGGFHVARRLVRPAGTLVLKSTFASAMREFDSTGLVVDEIAVVGSRCGPFGPALRLLTQRKIVVQPLIHARFPLDRATDALDYAKRPGVIKVLIVT